MVTIDSALDDIMQLDFESREMLLEILKKRQIEARRDEIVRNGDKTIEDYLACKLKAMSVEEAIDRLHRL